MDNERFLVLRLLASLAHRWVVEGCDYGLDPNILYVSEVTDSRGAVLAGRLRSSELSMPFTGRSW